MAYQAESISIILILQTLDCRAHMHAPQPPALPIDGTHRVETRSFSAADIVGVEWMLEARAHGSA